MSGGYENIFEQYQYDQNRCALQTKHASLNRMLCMGSHHSPRLPILPVPPYLIILQLPHIHLRRPITLRPPRHTTPTLTAAARTRRGRVLLTPRHTIVRHRFHILLTLAVFDYTIGSIVNVRLGDSQVRWWRWQGGVRYIVCWVCTLSRDSVRDVARGRG